MTADCVLDNDHNDDIINNTSNDHDEIRHFISLDKSFIDLNKTINLTDITMLNISNCNLSTLPDCMATTLLNLSILFCSNNNFETLPSIIGECRKLQMIAFKSCHMKYIPPEVLQEQLRWLILTDNQISTLPDTIGRCTQLQKCMLSGNRLKSLPESIANCQNLELIRLASNLLVEPPITLLTKIGSLKWVALSDNPFVQNVMTQTAIPSLPIIDNVPDDTGDILGQGAGGITRKVQMPDGTHVAVKQYLPTVNITSDGLPEQEKMINCAIAAATTAIVSNNIDANTYNTDTSKNKAFIQVIGQTSSSSPNGTGGSLIMEYLENYTALAKPPSFVSCSRDVYDDAHFKITVKQAVAIVTDLLNALMELHKIGITHGDFYGHNILLQKHENPTNVKLSDYGAAFFYDKNTLYGQALEEIEIRAFTVLVEEIVTHVISSSDDDGMDSFKQFITKNQSAKTFESVYIHWNQIKLQQISKIFDGDTIVAENEEEEKV